MMTKRIPIAATILWASLAPATAVACSADLSNDAAVETYQDIQNSVFLAPPTGDLALDLKSMKLYARDGTEEWPDYLFYLGGAAEAGLVTIDARYDNGSAAAIDDLTAGRLAKEHGYLLLRIKPTADGAALSKRTGLDDADKVFYMYNGKMVVDAIDGNELRHVGNDDFRILKVRDHVVDVPKEIGAWLDDTWAMARHYDYKLDMQTWNGGQVAKPRQEHALIKLDPETCKWELQAADEAPVDGKFTTHAVEDTLAAIAGAGQEL